MLLKNKIFYIIVIPMLLLAVYQFYSVVNVFNLIDEVRSEIFVESAKEVKYASDVQFLTSLLNSTLFELESAFESEDTEAFSHALRVYRETQLQRYFSLQKLKEVLSESEEHSFQFIAIIDEYNLVEVTELENKISELDALNEQILFILARSNDTNSEGLERYPLIKQSNALTREIVGKLSSFTNKRYVKVDETSKLVAISENDARSTLLMICALGYLVAGLMVVLFYHLIILPLERFSRAIDRKSMDGIAWTALEPDREDEVGDIYRALNDYLLLKHGGHKNKPKKEKKSRTHSAKGKNGHGK